MVVKVEEIGEKGLEYRRELPVELLEEALISELSAPAKANALHAAQKAELKAFLRKVSGSVVLQADFEALLRGPCRRCLSPTTVPVPVKFTLSLVPDPKLAGLASEASHGRSGRSREEQPREKDEGKAASFEVEAVEQEPFDGKTIDLAPIVREQLLLAAPVDALCSEGCRGLCTVCGKNLNEGECGCDRKLVDPRWSALKGLKLN